jgi:MSHA biogenesis protein MshK
MRRALLRAALTIAAAVSAPQLLAQAMGDPTKPPGAGAAMQGMPDDTPAGRQLQSILFSGGRKVAVISGSMVPLGGMLGESRVVKITESEVVLKTGEEMETLKFFPGIDKQPVKRAPSRTRSDASAQGSSSRGGSK